MLYFASGIFYVPAVMPVNVRNIIAYNPFLHIIDCILTGFFRSYAPEWMGTRLCRKVRSFFVVAWNGRPNDHEPANEIAHMIEFVGVTKFYPAGGRANSSSMRHRSPFLRATITAYSAATAAENLPFCV